MKTSIVAQVDKWINERFPLAKFIAVGIHEEIPGGSRFSYALGSATMFLLMLQIFSGLWQMFYYVPSVDHAYESICYLRMQVPFGWLIHGLHYWGAHAFTVVIGLHMMRVFVWGSYKKPRELVWLLGITLLIMTVGFMFTGPVLAWDKVGYWAGKVGIQIGASVPIFGSITQALLQGTTDMGQATLTRFFVLHVAVIPGLTMLLVVLHIIAFRQFGSTGPWDPAKRKTTGQFWPDQLFKDAVVAMALFLLLLALTAFAPPPFEGSADPADTFVVPKPIWNLLFLYELLKYFHGALEPVATVGIPTFILLMLTSLPFLDRSPERNPAKRLFVMSCAGALVLFILVATILGYLSKPEEIPAVAMPISVTATASPASGEDVALTKDNGPAPKDGAPLVVAAPVKEERSSKPAEAKSADPEVPAHLNPLTHVYVATKGKELFKTIGCVECHTANGKPSKKQGPDLVVNLSGKTVTREWLTTQVKAPTEHNTYSTMPSYKYLGDETITALVDYLVELSTLQPLVKDKSDGAGASDVEMGMGVGSSGPMPKRGFGDSVNIIGSRHHGEVLYRNFCLQCHGPQGKIIATAAFKPIPGVPGLNPIADRLHSKVPAEFVRRIDSFMQHGMPNRSGGPNMPAFGDGNSLTQAQIADIQAYVLSLNDVDRTKIENPGMDPKDFFYLCLEIIGVFALLVGVLWWSRKLVN